MRASTDSRNPQPATRNSQLATSHVLPDPPHRPSRGGQVDVLRAALCRDSRHRTMKPEQLLRKVFPPMLATLTDEAPRDRAAWSYELKYDGFRAVAAIVKGSVAMWSRNELDLGPRFPLVAAALQKMKAKE